MDEVAFGRYRLLSVIGQGGMGKVYRAHDTVLGRDVAIKVLSTERATEPGYGQRFRREAQITARLTEPHIIRIYEAGEIEGQLYLVMPVIEGTDVHSLLQRDGPMRPQRAVHVIEQLAAALDAAHAVGLVHRDIKPSNALVAGRDFVYLIDFGIVHDATATKLTKTGAIVGTLAYMAPERFTTGVADARADIYSLTCVLHECLTGTQPYPSKSAEQQIAGHLTLDPPKPSSLKPAISAAFDDVIARGMAKDPDQRYQTASDLVAGAQRALSTDPSRNPHTAPARFTPRPTLLHDQLPPPSSPAPKLVWQQPAHLNQTVAPQRPVGGAAPQPGPADWPAAQVGAPPPPWGQRLPRRLKWPLIAAIAVILVATAGITGYLLRPRSPAPQAPPVSEAALPGLLLSPDQMNTAMGATAMTVFATNTGVGDDSAFVTDQACLPLQGPAQATVYAGSGWTAMRWQELKEPGGTWTHLVDQGVVLFSSAYEAGAFFTASTQRWPACSNRQLTYTKPGQPDGVWTVGPVSNTNGILSATKTLEGGNGQICQRALTVANNVAIDVVACSYTQSDATAGVNIAHGIAAKVPTTS